MSPVLKILDKVLDEVDWKRMPWHIRRTAMQLKQHAHTYLVDVCIFLNRGTMVIGKKLSFHLEQISCFNKGKIKGLQFGRAFQLGRIGGNFLIVGNNTSIRMEDKSSVQLMFATHKNLFGNMVSVSAALDKGYYSKDNKVFIEKETGTSLGLQKPGEPIHLTIEEKNMATSLTNRRAGIEALIGHAKQGGQLGKSRMKSDRTTESSGYAAILGFNGRQLVRYLKGAAVSCK